MANGRTIQLMCVLLLVTGLIVVPVAPAASTGPETHADGIACEQLDPDWETAFAGDRDRRAQSTASGDSFRWNLTESPNGQTAQFSSPEPVAAAVVTSVGTGGAVYRYEPGVFTDRGLAAPADESGTPTAIDSVMLCVDPPDPGHVVVAKVTDPPGADEIFDFSSSIEGFAPQLTDGSEASVEVRPGEYTVTEAPIDGWTLSDISCDAAATADPSAGTVSFGVSEGETVRCVFTNTRDAPPEPAMLTLEKVTDPANEEVAFRFFSSIDDWKPLLGHGESSTIEVEPGTYTLTESPEHAWELTSIVCEGGEAEVDLEAGTATVTVAAGEHATCTFTNTATCPKHGYIAVEKYTDPVDDTVPFSFVSDAVSRDGDPFLPVLHHGESDYVMVLPGTYSITEVPVPGWELTALSCDAPDSAVDLSTGTATVTISSGELATCVFTNTTTPPPPTGTLVIEKMTDPSGSTGSFEFTSSVPGFAPVLGDGESAGVEVDEGVYTVTELLPDGWELSDLSCTDPEAIIDPLTGTATVFVPAEATVTCTFTNRELPPATGTLVIEKVTEPSGAVEAFGFVTTTGGDMVIATDDLTDGESATHEVAPGTYTVTEVFEEGWDLTAITCDPAGEVDLLNRSSTVTVTAGATVTCTFTNVPVPPETGKLIIEKVTDPSGASEAFGFVVTDGDGAFVARNERTDGERVVHELYLGTYTVTEEVEESWDLTAITCDPAGVIDMSDRSATVEVEAGETVTCTFTNTQEPEPVGSIGDFVWEDRNKNGIQDSGEAGIPNVRINLYSADSSELLATTTSDGNGNYLFADLPAGGYIVEFAGIPNGYRFTAQFAAGKTIDSDAFANGRTPVFNLAAGFNDVTCDAGLYALGDVLPETGGQLWLPFWAGNASLALGLVLLAATRPRRALRPQGMD